MVSPGFIRRISLAAAITILANIFQSGSTLKSQCERLFGSFHSMTASTMRCVSRSWSCGHGLYQELESAFEFTVEDVLTAVFYIRRTANPRLRFWMRGDFQA